MGCDMHYVLEKQIYGYWVGVVGSDLVYARHDLSNRWYTFYAELASVRGDTRTSLPANGLPDDISALSERDAKLDGFHSHSHRTLIEVFKAFHRARKRDKADGPFDLDFGEYEPIEQKQQYDETNFDEWCDKYLNRTYVGLKITKKNQKQFRLVFWFDS